MPTADTAADLVTRARAFADDVLFPNALAVDASGALPVANLDRIAEVGLYGLVGPTGLGGAGADHETQLSVIEAMAGGCLNTTFVWTQHQGATAAAVRATGTVHERWAGALSRGEAKGGVAFAHLMRPTPVLTAEATEGGWLLDGIAPWVTGWGYIDVFLAAARTGEQGERIVWSLVDARSSSSLEARALRLSAVDASGTFELAFRRHFVPEDRVTSVQPFDQWMTEYPRGLRTNGSLGLGVAVRAARLLGPSEFDGALERARHDLDTADVEELPAARGRLGALSVKLTACLIATVGGRGVLADHHAQRLAREALFLLIQGQTPAIRDTQVASLLPHR